MNSFSNETDSLKPLYMSQTEANAVMQLWAHRQQEEAARQSMVTVHDVAEATQLSQLEVQKLLSEIRSQHSEVEAPKRRVESLERNLVTGAASVSLEEAYRRLAPFLAVVSIFLGFYLYGELGEWGRMVILDPRLRHLENLCYILWFYSLVTLTPFFARAIVNWFRSLTLPGPFRLSKKTDYGNR